MKNLSFSSVESSFSYFHDQLEDIDANQIPESKQYSNKVKSLMCPSNNVGHFVCTTETCSHPSIVCQKYSQCQCAFHKHCDLYSFRLIINNILKRKKQSYQLSCHIISDMEKLIMQINQLKNEFTTNLQKIRFTDDERNMLKLLNQDTFHFLSKEDKKWIQNVNYDEYSMILSQQQPILYQIKRQWEEIQEKIGQALQQANINISRPYNKDFCSQQQTIKDQLVLSENGFLNESFCQSVICQTHLAFLGNIEKYSSLLQEQIAKHKKYLNSYLLDCPNKQHKNELQKQLQRKNKEKMQQFKELKAYFQRQIDQYLSNKDIAKSKFVQKRLLKQKQLISKKQEQLSNLKYKHKKRLLFQSTIIQEQQLLDSFIWQSLNQQRANLALSSELVYRRGSSTDFYLNCFTKTMKAYLNQYIHAEHYVMLIIRTAQNIKVAIQVNCKCLKLIGQSQQECVQEQRKNWIENRQQQQQFNQKSLLNAIQFQFQNLYILSNLENELDNDFVNTANKIKIKTNKSTKQNHSSLKIAFHTVNQSKKVEYLKNYQTEEQPLIEQIEWRLVRVEQTKQSNLLQRQIQIAQIQCFKMHKWYQIRNSKIISNKQYDNLIELLNTDKKIANIKLIYSANQNGFSVEEYNKSKQKSIFDQMVVVKDNNGDIFAKYLQQTQSESTQPQWSKEQWRDLTYSWNELASFSSLSSHQIFSVKKLLLELKEKIMELQVFEIVYDDQNQKYTNNNSKNSNQIQNKQTQQLKQKQYNNGKQLHNQPKNVTMKHIISKQKTQIDSKILNRTNISVLHQFFNSQSKHFPSSQYYTKAMFTLKLLYRASDNNFSTRKFHQMCDGVSSTIVLVKTEFSKIIGGYTSIPWGSVNNDSIHGNTFAQQSSNSSFLFSLSNKDKLILSNHFQSTVKHNREHGPIFGAWSHDLFISNNANTQKNWANIGNSYTNQKYPYNQKQTFKRFTGSQDGYFKIVEWQVFQLRFEQNVQWQ